MGLFRKIKSFFSGSFGIASVDRNDSTETKIFNPYIDSDAISGLSTAYLKLENKFGMKSTGKCGICVKDVNLEAFEKMKKEVQDFLAIASNEQKKEQVSFSFETLLDEYHYLWFILKGNSIEDLVAGINAVGDTIHEKGFSRQLLGAVFEFTRGYEGTISEMEKSGLDSEKNMENTNQYLIYNYKTDTFYPFVPEGPVLTNGRRKRNNQMEFDIMKEITDEIPIQKDYTQWYPIWNIPL